MEFVCLHPRFSFFYLSVNVCEWPPTWATEKIWESLRTKSLFSLSFSSRWHTFLRIASYIRGCSHAFTFSRKLLLSANKREAYGFPEGWLTVDGLHFLHMWAQNEEKMLNIWRICCAGWGELFSYQWRDGNVPKKAFSIFNKAPNRTKKHRETVTRILFLMEFSKLKISTFDC